MKDIIVALDFNDFSASKKVIDSLNKDCDWFKVGLEAFYSHGDTLLTYLESKNKSVFLDLKLHDIPTTVVKSLSSLLKKYPVSMTNIHALGGIKMLEQSASIVESLDSDIKLLGVTVLTSHSQSSFAYDLKSDHSIQNMVLHLNSLCIKSGLDGVVCSPLEALSIRNASSCDYIIVTPGVRLNSGTHDQSRILTPSEAFDNGASHIVVGREVTLSDDPYKSFCLIKESIHE